MSHGKVVLQNWNWLFDFLDFGEAHLGWITAVSVLGAGQEDASLGWSSWMFRGASGWKSDHFFGEENREWNIQISRFDFWGIFCRFWCGISWEYHGILMGFSDFDGKIPIMASLVIPKISWPVLLSRCGCGSLPWRRTNWAAGLREPIGIWSIWNISWICWNWMDNGQFNVPTK